MYVNTSLYVFNECCIICWFLFLFAEKELKRHTKGTVGRGGELYGRIQWESVRFGIHFQSIDFVSPFLATAVNVNSEWLLTISAVRNDLWKLKSLFYYTCPTPWRAVPNASDSPFVPFFCDSIVAVCFNILCKTAPHAQPPLPLRPNPFTWFSAR